MAVYIPIRPRWNPRGVVVNYVFRDRLCVRGWPKGYHDANTPEQQRQRGKMAQACGVLPYLKALLMEGYTPIVKRNGRKVSSYHVAVGVALREWFVQTAQGFRFDPARIRLTDGVGQLPAGLEIGRSGGALRVSLGAPLPWGEKKLLLAVRCQKESQWVSGVLRLNAWEERIEMELPEAWRGQGVEVWVAFVGNGGRSKTATRYILLPAGATLGGGASVGSRSSAPSPRPPWARKSGTQQEWRRGQGEGQKAEGACGATRASPKRTLASFGRCRLPQRLTIAPCMRSLHGLRFYPLLRPPSGGQPPVALSSGRGLGATPWRSAPLSVPRVAAR